MVGQWGLARSLDFVEDRGGAGSVDGCRGIPHVVGAQIAGFHASAPWSQPSGPVWFAAAYR